MKHALILSLLVTLHVWMPTACAEPVSPAGEKLVKTLDAMEVEKHWIAGAIVDWRHGEPTGQKVTDSGSHTHCSQFAAAFCDSLGVYLLHPPEHKSTLLANAQYEWLASEKGKQRGWSPVPDGTVAQHLANEGRIVIAVVKNPDAAKSGHTAVIRPSDKSEADIAKEGPQVTQAGGSNYNSASLKQGFKNHPGAFKNHEIKFFSHTVETSKKQ